LLIDDVQFLMGKEQTEESFFHTFNELHNANHQIVLASDRPPKSLPDMGDRLCSRFEWGLIADIQPPDFNTRLAILKAKAKQQEIEVALDVLEFIAQCIQQNIRELEGSLNRAVAYAKLFGAILTPELAARAVQDISTSSNKTNVTPELVIKAVAERFQLTPADLIGRKRDRATALARQVAMHLLKEAGNCSLAQIGLEFGHRDHATVIHACHKIANDMDNDPYLRRQVLDIQKKLQRPPRARR
jgi:chromosomal replication initiator protein